MFPFLKIGDFVELCGDELMGRLYKLLNIKTDVASRIKAADKNNKLKGPVGNIDYKFRRLPVHKKMKKDTRIVASEKFHRG